MALAYLRLESADDDRFAFSCDIGSSRFFRYLVGPGFSARDDRDLLTNIHFQSDLIERDETANPFNSVFELQIPVGTFDRDNRFVQIQSFRTALGSVPAWSRVREVRPEFSGDPYSFSKGAPMIETLPRTQTRGTELIPARSIPMNVSESRFSSAMFWDQILEIARHLVPQGANLVSGLINQQRPGTSSPNDIQQIINGLLGILGNVTTAPAVTNGTPPAQPTAPPPVPPASAAPATAPVAGGLNPGPEPSPGGTILVSTPASLMMRNRPAPRLSRKRFATRNRRRLKRRHRNNELKIQRFSRQQDGGVISGPMLAGLVSSLAPSVLQALGPLFQQAPQLLETVQDYPIRFLTAINQADLAQEQLTNQRVQNMLAQGNAALLAHLLRRNEQPFHSIPPANVAAPPPLAPPQPPPIPGSTTQSYRRGGARPGGARVQSDPRIRLKFDLAGQPAAVPVYSANASIVFQLRPFTNLTPPSRPIPDSKLKLWIKRDDEILLQKQISLRDVMLNENISLALDPQEFESLPRHDTLRAVAEFAWRTKEGQIFTAGNRGLLDFRVTGPVLLESLGERRQQEVELADPTRYRSFWHRIWEGGANGHRRWELDLQARYYYVWKPTETGNGRMETRLNVSEPSNSTSKRELRGKLKSGLELDPGELLKLLPLFGEEAWSIEEEALLGSDEFFKRANQQASARLELRGRDDERGSIWVFPILDLIDVQLGKVTKVNEFGLVTATESYTRPIPMPISAVFVGAQLEN